MPTDVNALIRRMLSTATPEPTPEPSRAGRSAREGEYVDLTPRAPVDPNGGYDPAHPPPALPDWMFEPNMHDPQFEQPVRGSPELGDPQGPSIDPRFAGKLNRNPDGADAGPLYATPEAAQWLKENVIDRGYFIDWGTYEAFNPDTGDRFKLPTEYPAML